ncbi:MAG TPA: thioesterase family protein [Ignavibacteria bacterium]|nr:thioesterase family protein [Ignavibacteria bacterium]
MIKNEHIYRPLYAHTDIMGIVNNTRYLEYFEAGRNELMRNIGYPYTKLEAGNIGLPLIEAHVNYYKPAKYDDELRIIAYLKSLPTVRIKIDYEIMVGDLLLVDGYTTHSFLDLKRFKPVRPPADFLELLKTYFI